MEFTFDWTLYWFMFPVSMLVATTAMVSGIGGAAMFTPIFLIIFPGLGPEYVLPSAVAAIGAALLTEVFGFSSGFVGYFRKRLIDFKGARQFILLAVPVGVFGALISHQVDGNALKAAYATLMIFLSYVFIRHQHEPEPGTSELGVENSPPGSDDGSVGARDVREKREITARDGTVYRFHAPRQGKGALLTSFGAFLTGMVSVGIGEVIMPQLAKRNRVPVPVAAATSVFVVIVTVAAASFTQISTLVAEGGWHAVPWNLVAYTVPGVIIGGQIGPRIQGKVSHRAMERVIGVLFLVISLSMFWLVYKGLGGLH